ncbi:MAG: DUF6311 domain-containing protein [Rhodoglobus sp.]
MSPPISDRRTDLLVAGFVGFAAFLAIVGPAVLDVGNMLWLTQNIDSFTHYVGWAFYRHSAWTWPLGFSPDYGLQFSSAIIFSDSVPLLAIPLKLVSPLLPAVFQYTGWWVLACFVLQAYFAERIAGLFTRDAVIKLALAILLTFAPPMLWRLSVHYSLVAHWTLLAGIYLYWAHNSMRRGVAWTLLLGASVLVHTYFFAMLLPIWLASIVRRRLLDRSSPWIVEFVAVVAVALAALWIVGFFPLRSSMLSTGYGYFRLNLLGLVNPQGGILLTDDWAWSSILPVLPHAFGDYEGFTYAGLGGLGAMALALPLLFTERRAYRGKIAWPLIIAALLLTLFALTPNLALANRGLEIPVPQFIFDLASSMRSSGRFFWPVYYMLPIGAAWLIYKAMGEKVAGPVLLLLAALQVYDTSPGWLWLRSYLAVSGSSFATTIDDPRLGEVSKHYQAVRAIPPMTMMSTWEQVAYFALRHDLPTDAAYLARPDETGLTAYMGGIDDAITNHKLVPNALYFLDRDYAAQVSAAMGPTDAMFHVGDFYEFAPGWHAMNVPTTLPDGRP